MADLTDIDAFRAQIEGIADQLCYAVDGRFDFRVKQDTSDASLEKLQMLINFMLDSMARSVVALEQQSDALKKQVELAEAANSAKANFLANMSHEIRTPLNGIVGLTSLLEHSQLNAEQSDLVNGVRLSSDNLLATINDILDFSKIEAGKIELESIRFDLYALTQDIAESLAIRAAEKHIELIVRFMPGTPRWVTSDKAKLRQVIINLLGNALKFTDSGHILMSISHNIDGYYFEVQDTGIGIETSHHAHLFDEFTQADSTITRKFGGTGLGLAICKKIVEALNGQLGVKAHDEGGSIFWFSLPLIFDTTEAEYDKHRAVLPSADHPQQQYEGLHVLIVEDNPIARLVLAEQLQSRNIPHQQAGSAVEALEKQQLALKNGKPFTVALLDYSLPDMNGLILSRHMQKHSADNFLANVLLAPINKSFSKRVLLDQHISGFLLKPAAPDFVDALLQRLVQKMLGHATDELITRQILSADKAQGPIDKSTNKMTLHVLVAEDNIVNQKVAKGLLEKQGCVVHIANNGVEALEQLNVLTLDMIFMDMQMPSMNGIEATQHIRNHPNKAIRDLPIIALTANATPADREACFKAGMSDYISKPFQMADLKAMLQNWMPVTAA